MDHAPCASTYLIHVHDVSTVFIVKMVLSIYVDSFFIVWSNELLIVWLGAILMSGVGLLGS